MSSHHRLRRIRPSVDPITSFPSKKAIPRPDMFVRWLDYFICGSTLSFRLTYQEKYVNDSGRKSSGSMSR